MFGYVKTYKNELKVIEYEVFQSYYCGLCKTLKSEYGFFARLGLNYDSVFLALLLSSVTNDLGTCAPERCIASPLKKKPVRKTEKCMSYSAAVMIILAVLKLSDDIRDEKSIKSLISYIALINAKRRVKKNYGELYNECRSHILALSRLEKENCSSIDKLANEFAEILKRAFTPDFIKDEDTKRILGHIGYMLGRFIYIADAFDDLERDKKKKCFNAFLLCDTPPTAEEIRDLLTLSLSSIAGSYELLNIKINKPILDNIIYLGLSKTLDDLTILKGDKI